MDLVAERGMAAHWVYKNTAALLAQQRAEPRPRVDHGLLESQRSAGSSLEFLENVKVDLFPDEVYLFTPKGEILALPRNATALDFAYAVHTDVGNHAVAARVDKKLVPLRSKLVSGQTVEIITAKSAAAPIRSGWSSSSPSKARTAIRHSSSISSTRMRCELGHRMLDRALEARTARWIACRQRRWSSIWRKTACAALKTCWRRWRSATACRSRWRRP
jgi:guanosine-3',5'-bis(diphosphate) 3'-pyrophosphohydrolase